MDKELENKIDSALFRTAELTLRVSSLEKLLVSAGTFTESQLHEMNELLVNKFKDLIKKELENKQDPEKISELP